MNLENQEHEYQSPIALARKIARNGGSILLFLVLAAVGMLAVYWYFEPSESDLEAFTPGQVGETSYVYDPEALLAPIIKPRVAQPVAQRLDQSPGPQRIGIIAGHRGSDSGTVCSDGFTEVQITNSVAEQVMNALLADDIYAETLDEFDPRLEGYSATALVSIHVDSCDFINDEATGFKIAGSPRTDSSGLSICVQQAYSEMTKLPYHANSITPHMAQYHAFNKISRGTPAIIIEVGFLNLDREILTTGSGTVVEGLTTGIRCFLNR